MTNAKKAEWELRHNKTARIPRTVTYQERGQLPLTLLALIAIATALFAVWFFSV